MGAVPARVGGRRSSGAGSLTSCSNSPRRSDRRPSFAANPRPARSAISTRRRARRACPPPKRSLRRISARQRGRRTARGRTNPWDAPPPHVLRCGMRFAARKCRRLEKQPEPKEPTGTSGFVRSDGDDRNALPSPWAEDLAPPEHHSSRSPSPRTRKKNRVARARSSTPEAASYTWTGKRRAVAGSSR